MDMCDACADKQQWLLESGDGSQVICLCQIDENSQVEDNMQNNDEIPTTIDVGVQTSETTDRQQSLFKANVESQIKAECKNCRSKFSRPDGLKRHQNYSCKIKNNGREESQQSQLETGDGDSQVQDGDMVGVSQSDIAVQTPKRMTSPINIRTPPLKRSSPSIPNAPKRKFAKFESRIWKNSGYDIRRHLFDFQDCRIMEKSRHKNWAILKVDTILTSKNHHCIRRFYIGDKNGVNYLETEFYPCVKYTNLSEEYKRLFHQERNHGHKLPYNPRQRSAPCTLAIKEIEEFVEYNNINLILYNVERGSVSEDIYSNIGDTISVGFLNIRWEFRCG